MVRRSVIFTLAVLLSLSSLIGQTPSGAQERFQRIEKLVSGGVTEWVVQGGSEVWAPFRLGRSLPLPKSRLRKTLLPPAYLFREGTPSTSMRLLLAFSSRGISEVRVSVDGRPVETITVDGSDGTMREVVREVSLAQKVENRPYEVVLDVENRGFLPPRGEFWPPRSRPLKEEAADLLLTRSELLFPAFEKNLQEVRSWVSSLKTAFGLLRPEMVRYTFTKKPYPLQDRRKTPKERLQKLEDVWNAAVSAFDPEALEKGDWRRVKGYLSLSYKIAQPLKSYANEYKVHLIGNAHIDIAWLWRMAETELVAKNTFSTVLDNMKEYPELYYAQSQAVTYRWMEAKYPDLFKRIGEAVKDGRWEIVGGTWVEPDCNLISGESWARQLLYGKEYFREKFGVDVKIGWNPDSFGYNWNMPQLYKKAGIDIFITQKIQWNDTTVFPHYLFWWEGPDGTRMLTYFPPSSYTDELKLQENVQSIGKYEAVTGSKESLILYGLGDHGGGPNRELLNRVRASRNLFIVPEYIHGKAGDFLLSLVKRAPKMEIPIWKDELYLEYHRGTYTTQGETKKNNRLSENRLSWTEKLAFSASTAGFPWPKERLEEAWKSVLTNQFHDILPGSSITPVYRDARESYAKAFSLMERVERAAEKSLGSSLNLPKGEGTPVMVFNPLSWERTDIASVRLPLQEGRAYKAYNLKGEPLVTETLPNGEGEADVSFLVQTPSLGYTVAFLREVSPEEAKGGEELSGDAGALENRYFKVKINPKSGNLSSLFDKRLNRELLAPGKEGNLLELWEDRPQDWDAWNIGYTGRVWNLNKADRVELVSMTPLRAVLKVEKSFLGLFKGRSSPTEDFPSSFFTQYITLYSGLDRIDIRTEADWWEEHVFLKASFPLDVQSDTAVFEIPFAAISRTTKRETLEEKAKFEVSALKWADLSDSRGGLSLLNDSKYGYSAQGDTLRISLLRSPVWPDPMADKGRHEFTYSLYPHRGLWNEGETVRRGYELNQPLRAYVLSFSSGALPPERSLLEVTGKGVVIDSVKAAQDGAGWILRLYESLGQEERVELSLFSSPESVQECDLLERRVADLEVGEGKVPLLFKPFEVKSLRVRFSKEVR